jgi:hypothetical protein
VLALLVAFVVPSTVGAWNLPTDATLKVTTPAGDLVAKVMKITLSLLSKWVYQTTGTVEVENVTCDPVSGFCVWGTYNADAIVVGGLTGHGETLVAGIADVVTWGTAVLADIVRMMGGAP